VRTGLEPATLGVTGRYSNRLNYRTRVFFRDLIGNKSSCFFTKFTTLLKNKPPEIRFSKGFANIAFLSFPAIGQIKKITYFSIKTIIL
jgi:hypothetical protein